MKLRYKKSCGQITLWEEKTEDLPGAVNKQYSSSSTQDRDSILSRIMTSPCGENIQASFLFASITIICI